MFDKCHWKDKGNTFEEIMNSYKVKRIFLLNSIDYTLNYKCIYKYYSKYYNIILNLDSEFSEYLEK
jgi:hypothetical protein